MSLNDVCCYIPAWFGVIASSLCGLIAYECSLECNTETHIFATLWDLIRLKGATPTNDDTEMQKSSDKSKDSWSKWKISVVCGVIATNIMAIVPAHMMRSVGGGFDNESVAMSTMLLTFYFWVRSLRGGEKYSFLYGIFTGVAYFYVSTTKEGIEGFIFYLHIFSLVNFRCSLIMMIFLDGCDMGRIRFCIEYDRDACSHFSCPWTVFNESIPIFYIILCHWNSSCDTNPSCWSHSIEKFRTTWMLCRLPGIPSIIHL